MDLINPFTFCADHLAKAALPPGVSAADVHHRIAWLRQVGGAMPVGCNDPNIAMALGRAALDSEARKSLLLTLLALQAYIDAAEGYTPQAQRLRDLTLQVEEVIK